MPTSTVFTNNRTQAVRLPAELRMPEGVKHVDVRARGVERIIAPAGASWDSFFSATETVSDDFMNTRASQTQADRDTL
ncbi:MAG: antitoxin [Burkholderiales bacterium]|nr:MAG: antitoxin [Burkholderiales bacterium]TAG82043.1 MAG: antitoxin [Betaproteobacteria bacterium]